MYKCCFVNNDVYIYIYIYIYIYCLTSNVKCAALPILFEPPTVSRVNGDQLNIRWFQWIPGVTGNGSGPVVGYTLQALTQFPSANWQDIHVLPQIGSLLREVETRLTQTEENIRVQSEDSEVVPSQRPGVNSGVNSLDHVVPNSESPTNLRLFSFITANLLPNTAYKFRVVLIGLYLEKPESSWPGPATPLWTTTACGCKYNVVDLIEIM